MAGDRGGAIEIQGPNREGHYKIRGWMPYFEHMRDHYVDCAEIIEDFGEVAARESFAVVAVHDYRLTEMWIESRKRGLKDMYMEKKQLVDQSAGRVCDSTLMEAWANDGIYPTVEEIDEVISEFEDELMHFYKHRDAIKKWLDVLNTWLRGRVSSNEDVLATLPLHVPVDRNVTELVAAFKADEQRAKREERQRAMRAEVEEQRRRSKEAYAEREREAQAARERAKSVDRLHLWCRRHRIEQQAKKELFEASILRRAREEKLRAERAERAQRANARTAPSTSLGSIVDAQRPDQSALTNEERAHRDGFSKRCKAARSRDFNQRQVAESDAAAERRRAGAVQRQRDIESQKSKNEAVRTHALPNKPTLASIIDVALSDQIERVKLNKLPSAQVVPVESASAIDMDIPVFDGSAVAAKPSKPTKPTKPKPT